MAPNDRGWEEIRTGIALSSIAFVAVILRFVARYVRRLQLEIDDWLSLASLVAIVAMLVELILCEYSRERKEKGGLNVYLTWRIQFQGRR
jgi:dolichol kinase